MSPVSKGVKRRGAESGTDCEAVPPREVGGEKEAGGEVEGWIAEAVGQTLSTGLCSIMARRSRRWREARSQRGGKACPCVCDMVNQLNG